MGSGLYHNRLFLWQSSSGKKELYTGNFWHHLSFNAASPNRTNQTEIYQKN
jgi:hypothetical protein